MKKLINIGSDCSGVGAFNQALIRLGIKYDEIFACDFDFYARQTYLLNFGTQEDIELGNSKEHKKYADGVKKIALSEKENTIEDDLFLIEANEYAKKFSFYYPFNMYQRDIPRKSIDIYVSSVPCQAFSISGKRLGKEDKRGILFFNSLEFIQQNKPRFFIFENVKGLLSHDKIDPKAIYGRTFQEWINYLGGKSVNGVHTFFPYEDSVPYHIYFQVLNAKHYGIPQNRERIFIVGIRDDEDNDFQFPKTIPLEKRLKDVLENEVDEKYFLSDNMINYLNTRKDNFNNGNINYKDEFSIASTLTKSSSSLDISDNILKVGFINQDTQASQVFSENGTSPNICAGTHGYALGYVETTIGTWRTHEDGKGFRETKDNNCPTIPARAREDGSGQPVIKVTQLNPSTESGGKQPYQQNRVYDIEGLSTTLCKDKSDILIIQTNNSKGFDEAEEEEDSINFSVPNSKTRRGRVGKKVSQTLDTQCNQGIFTQQRIRRLTPLECFRLMDFNFDIPGVKDFIWDVSDSQAYKQAGNSICVGVLAAIINKLKAIIND